MANNQKRLVIISGAGLSAESGIQTFRDDNGLWANHNVDQICNINTWKKNFKLVHNFYNARRKELKNKTPNAMHYQIYEWQKQLKQNCIIITQNIDDLLEKAGCENVIHLHGFANKIYCFDCKYKYEDLQYKPYNFKPCIKCNSKWIKPDIVFFGEAAPKYSILYSVVSSLNNNDMLLVIGTSGAVININGLASLNNALKILNNLHQEIYIDATLFDYVFYEKATTAASKIDEIIKKWQNR
ncbi:MAG: NAD-dependent deacetylase [Malacoplasma sp.]|nr:NAD-dependent deacetylase [Malacoplasma sp.]